MPQTLPCVRLSVEEADALCAASDVTCDPYTHLTWTISAAINPAESDETDLICFDHAMLADGRLVLMSTLDCASTGALDAFACFLCAPTAALETAQAMIDDAYDWFRASYEPDAIDSNASDWLTTMQHDLNTQQG